jgi:hypothetical protein
MKRLGNLTLLTAVLLLIVPISWSVTAATDTRLTKKRATAIPNPASSAHCAAQSSPGPCSTVPGQAGRVSRQGDPTNPTRPHPSNLANIRLSPLVTSKWEAQASSSPFPATEDSGVSDMQDTVGDSAEITLEKLQAAGAKILKYDNRVVRVQSFDSVDLLGGAPGVEIELHSKSSLPGVNQLVALQIGKYEFARDPYRDATSNRLIFTLTAEEFARIEDGSEIMVKLGLGVSVAAVWPYGKLKKERLIKHWIYH